MYPNLGYLGQRSCHYFGTAMKLCDTKLAMGKATPVQLGRLQVRGTHPVDNLRPSSHQDNTSGSDKKPTVLGLSLRTASTGTNPPFAARYIWGRPNDADSSGMPAHSNTWWPRPPEGAAESQGLGTKGIRHGGYRAGSQSRKPL
jgi:hypothetical protein